jgi:hypothetical protein
MSIRIRSNWRLSTPFALVLFAPSPATIGQELITGWEGSSSRGYAFVSPVVTVHRSDQFSWIVRGSLSYLYYDFPEGNGKTKVRSPGESLGIAFRYSAPGITATIGPGYETRQTKRRLASGAETRENEDGVLIQGDVSYQVTPLTNLSLLGSYSGANDYVWVRAGVKRQITNFDHQGSTTLHVGAEVTGQGNKDSKSAQIGPVLEIAYPRVNTSLQLRAGLQRVEAGDSRNSQAYFGAGLYRAF